MSELFVPVTAIYVGINAIILMALGAMVTARRAKLKIDYGDGGNELLIKAIRAHGNATEYVPTALILLAVLELLVAPLWLLHALGIALTVGRLAHAQGMYQSLGVSPGRFVGATLTWLVLLVGGLACLYIVLI